VIKRMQEFPKRWEQLRATRRADKS
jgi:hypothetical protein